MTPESKTTAEIIRYLKSLKAAGQLIWWVKLWGNVMQRAGLPDLIVLYRGRLLAVEIKRPGGNATLLQVHTLKEMERAGARPIVARCVEDVRRVIEETSPPRAGWAKNGGKSPWSIKGARN